MKKLPVAVSFACALIAASAWADGAARTAFVAQGGITPHGTYTLTAGVAWPLAWRRMSRSGEWTAMAEVFVSHWSSRVEGGRESLTQFGVLPVVRFRFDQGRSDWFAEGGIGATYLDRRYRRDHKQFATRFNFQDVVGVGRSFGAHRENELSLRAVHVSNAGIKQPNPGENFLQLHYARQF